MHELSFLLKWFSNKTGAQLLLLPENPYHGFSDVKISMRNREYGFKNNFSWEMLKKYKSIEDIDEKYFSKDLNTYYRNRSFNIAKDTLSRLMTQKNKFEFYNGKLARLKGVDIITGNSPFEQVLKLNMEYTSYFTSLGTNIHFNGYNYFNSKLENEKILSNDLKWPIQNDWNAAVKKSPLANPIAVNLILYNDKEIFYVKRGHVGQQSDYYNSTVDGVMEFNSSNSDFDNHKPSIYKTAIRETLYELGITIDEKNIRWIGLAATIQRCEPYLIGICQIDYSKKELLSRSLNSQEHREIAEKHKKYKRRKVIKSLYRGFNLSKLDISFWVSFSIPTSIKFQLDIKKFIEKNVLFRTIGHDERTIWTAEGVSSLLVSLPYIFNEKIITDILNELKNKYSKKTLPNNVYK